MKHSAQSRGQLVTLSGPLGTCLLLIAVSFLAFANSLPNAFHLDDFYRVVDNPGIQKVAPWWRHFFEPRTMSTLDRVTQYRPLLPLTLSFNYFWGGENPIGYHLFNLVIHCLAACMFYLVCLELLKCADNFKEKQAAGIALSAATIFAVHPVSGIAVNYVSARDLGMMLLFSLAALWCYVRSCESAHKIGWITISLIFFVLGLFSKTNVVVVPLIIVAFEVIMRRKRLTEGAVWYVVVPYLFLIAAHALFVKFVLKFSDWDRVVNKHSASLLEYPLTQAKLQLFYYLPHFLWPFGLRQAPYVEPATSFLNVQVLCGICFIAATLWLVIRWRESNPLGSFCILSYWLLMAPESSIIPFHNLAADYRAYPSAVFLYLLAAYFICSLLSRRSAVFIVVMLVAYLGWASWYLNRTWLTEESLWSHSVEQGGAGLAHLNLAMSIDDRRDPRVRAHLEEAMRLEPGYILPRLNLGLLLIHLGETAQGIAYCEEAVAQDPGRAQSHYWLSRAYQQVAMPDKALAAMMRAAEIDAGAVKYQIEAAQQALRAGKLEQARIFLQRAEAFDASLPAVQDLRRQLGAGPQR